MNTSSLTLNIGLAPQDRKAIAEGLSRLLADTYVLAIKTQFCHWNVEGPYFISLHKLFGEQYEGLAKAVDLIAERIRSLGHFTPGSLKVFSTLTQIKEYQDPISWMDMVKQLSYDHETLSRSAKALVSIVNPAGDEATLNLLADRMDLHETAAWFLRSHVL